MADDKPNLTAGFAKRTMRCRKGHRWEEDTGTEIVTLSIYIGDRLLRKTKRVCPMCVCDWLEETFPEPEEVPDA